MTDTLTPTRARVYVNDGWAVRDLPNGDQVRARVLVDTWGGTEQPDWESWTGLTLVRERDSYGGINLGDHDGLREVLDRTYAPPNVHKHLTTTGVIRRESEEMQDFHWLKDGELPISREEFVARYLRAFWDVQDAFLFRHHADRDWADIWVIVENYTDVPSHDTAAAIVQEWSDWAAGNCYGFESETRTLRDALEWGEFGWKDADQCWGYFGDEGAKDGLAEALDVRPDDVPEPYEVTEF